MTRDDRIDPTTVVMLIVICALWGLQQVMVKAAAADGIGPLMQATIRASGAALLFLAWAGMAQGRAALRDMFRRDAALRPLLVLSAIFVVEFGSLFPGVRLTTASRGVLFLYTAPFFTALGAHFFLPAERLNLLQAAGLVVAFGGVGVAFADGLGAPGGSVLGDLLCLVAGTLWGITTVVVKANPVLAQVPPARILFTEMALASPFLLAAAVYAGEWSAVPSASWGAWGSMFYQTVIVAFGTYLLWLWMVKRYPASKLSGFTFLAPLFGIAAGWLFLAEPISPALLLGLAAIAIGLRMLNTRGKLPAQTLQPQETNP